VKIFLNHVEKIGGENLHAIKQRIKIHYSLLYFALRFLLRGFYDFVNLYSSVKLNMAIIKLYHVLLFIFFDEHLHYLLLAFEV
jgi:hypothetical protein